MKSHGLFVSNSFPIFSLVKAFFFPCRMETSTWLTIVEDPESQFSADP